MRSQFALTTMLIAGLLLTGSLARRAVAGEKGESIHQAVKGPFEKQFGALLSKVAHEKKQVFGTVIAVHLELTEGKLADGWPAQAVAALAEVGVTAEASKREVRAEKQSLAGLKFVSLQVTSARGVDEHDSLSMVVLIGR